MSDYMSVFVMIPCPDKKIKVFFSNILSKNKITDLTGLDASLRETIGIHREKYFAFVNGPRHDDSHNTLFKTYNYLCTSGGHPSFKSDEIGHWRSWTLDGWSKEEAALALSIAGHKDQAAMAYWLCGGNIRDMMSCCTPQGFRVTREDIDHVIKFIPTLQRQLVYWGTDRAKDSSDRWQTMFRGKLGYETIQFVDSEYVMTCLLKTTDLESFFKAFELSCENAEQEAIHGLYFKYIVHRWFIQTNLVQIESVCRPQETRTQENAAFDKTNEYWILSGPEFDSIDSAIVIDETLHVLQVTVKSIPNFILPKFRLLKRVQQKLTVHCVIIWVVVPRNSNFDVETFNELGVRPENLMINCRLLEVDVSTSSSIEASLQTIPFLVAEPLVQPFLFPQRSPSFGQHCILPQWFSCKNDEDIRLRQDCSLHCSLYSSVESCQEGKVAHPTP
jgi:hypothetical protein